MKRYDLITTPDWFGNDIGECINGKYVKFEDVDILINALKFYAKNEFIETDNKQEAIHYRELLNNITSNDVRNRIYIVQGNASGEKWFFMPFLDEEKAKSTCRNLNKILKKLKLRNDCYLSYEERDKMALEMKKTDPKFGCDGMGAFYEVVTYEL